MLQTDISNDNARNQLNLAMRQEPWYQDWFKQRGLNPNMVRLNDNQKQELQALVVGKGFLDPSDGHIDEAGNVSDFHGWKGLPTAAKIALIAGTAAATGGAMGAFGGSAGVVPGATAAPSLAGSTAAGAGSMASVAAPAAAGGKLAMIGKIAGLAGGGKMGTISKIANKVSPILGSMASSAAAGNRADDQIGLYRDRLNLDTYRTDQATPKLRMTDSVRADRISRGRPVSMNWGGPGSGLRGGNGGFDIQGGFSDDLVSPNTRRMSDDISYKNMMDQLSGKGAPVPGEVGKTSGFDKIVGGAATGAGILGAFGSPRGPGGGDGTIAADKEQVPMDEREQQIFKRFPEDIDDTENY